MNPKKIKKKLRDEDLVRASELTNVPYEHLLKLHSLKFLDDKQILKALIKDDYTRLNGWANTELQLSDCVWLKVMDVHQQLLSL